ncbi:Zinc knuckle, partial [Trichostrongylus colubriformis]
MLPFRDENVVEMEEPLDTPQQVRENDTISEFSILSERCNDALVSMYKSVMERLSDSRVTKEKRMEIEKEIKVGLEKVQSILKTEIADIGVQRELGKAVLNVLDERGITTVGDWMDYIRTTERDGELVAEICDMLKTDVLQVKEQIVALQVSNKENSAVSGGLCNDSTFQRVNGNEMNPLQKAACSTGPQYAGVWRRSESSTATEPALDSSGVLAAYLKSMACVDPGVFRGVKNENFWEFVRRFRRKYNEVVRCEATLVEILADDHLAGRAKNIFASLPRMIKEQGFDAVVNEMAKLLAHDSTAGRLRALTELKNLRIRPNQDVAEFCVVLERLGGQAYPEGSLEDRSLEYAQILLDNLTFWPEHFQLVSALHKVEPRRAYEEVKQLALSIEQSKFMLNAYRKPGIFNWKSRSEQYRSAGPSNPRATDREQSKYGPIRELVGQEQKGDQK